MIDFEKTINASDLIEWIMETDPDWCVGAIRCVVDHIDEMPSTQPEQRWIPCSERLPNTNGVYSVTRKISDGFECRNISDACYYDGTNTWHDDTRVNHERRYLTDVIAWMPLPEPYRGEPCAAE